MKFESCSIDLEAANSQRLRQWMSVCGGLPHFRNACSPLTNSCTKLTALRFKTTPGGFSLVEVTVAIGIFAFVAVGVLGLLPAALKQRSDASRESRAVLVAEELFSSIRAAPTISNVVLRRGTKPEDVIRLNLAANRIAIGYPAQSSVPYFGWWPGSEKGEYKDPDKIWRDGRLDAAAATNNIDMLALLHATNTPSPGLYKVTVEIRSPASLPLTNTMPLVFTTLFYRP